MYNKPDIITYDDKGRVASTGQTVQDNHYYPYGAMFGESAAVEYVNAMAGTNNMALINAEVSTNPYRYGGKEWLMQKGLNYYDFAARQYDPTTGRFIHPDPLNGKYPHLSPFLYCAGNPINATDPSGLAVIYDMHGNYLGQSDEGFSGGVYIYNGTINIDFSKYKEAELKKLKFVKEMGEVGKDLSLGAKLAIFNHVIAQFNGTYIYDEKFDTSRLEGGRIHYKKDNDKGTFWMTIFYNGENDVIIYPDPPKVRWANDFSMKYEATVENIASSVLVHEWYSHGLKHNSDRMKSHRLAYQNVINWKALWNKTTNRYKGFIMHELLEYTSQETGRTSVMPLYQNLYNKYI